MTRLLVVVLLLASLAALSINAISKMLVAAPTSGYTHGCSDAQISNPADRYINQSGKGPNFHDKAFMKTYNEGFVIAKRGTLY